MISIHADNHDSSKTSHNYVRMAKVCNVHKPPAMALKQTNYNERAQLIINSAAKFYSMCL